MTTVLLFVLGLLLLVGGAEVFVRGATRLAGLWGVPPVVIGLTVVALGTTAPEIAVCVQAALDDKAGLALGNVLGSNILNVLFILGVSATITPLTVSRQLIRLDVPIMIGVSVLVLLLSANGVLGRVDGVVLLALALGYTAFQVVHGRREVEADDCEFAATFGTKQPNGPRDGVLGGGQLVGGAVALVFGSRWLVAGAVAAARAMNLSEMIVGLTVVAIGTSLPEMATSIMASIKGQRDIAVGNVVGSNIYNVLAVLGSGALVAPTGMEVTPAALRFDMPVLVAVAVACLPIFFTGSRIARAEGIMFLFYYVAYTVYLILASSHHDTLPAFSYLMLLFFIPISLFGIGVSVWRSIKNRDKGDANG